MPAKPKKSGAATKSYSAFKLVTTTTTTTSSSASTPAAAPAAGWDTNPVTATQPAPSSNIPKSTDYSLYKERPGPTSTNGVSVDPDHRPSQPYPGAAPLRQVQQSPTLSSGQSHQPSFAVQGVFPPQGGIQSPYLNNPSQFQQHPRPSEGGYYASNPSPRSATGGAYYSQDKSDSMAAATATIQRPYASIYHTPQSNSPASVTSPQTHDHGRPLYQQQPPQMQQPIYPYSNYQPMGSVHQSPYGGHHHQPPQMNAPPLLPYQPSTNSLPQGTMPSQPPTMQLSPRIKNEGPQQYAQTPQSQASLMQQRHPTSATSSNTSMPSNQPPPPPTTSNAAPGPIPATTPLVVRQDNNGVQWILFEYSRDRVKMEYTIRCDVESVDANQLTQEFKGENCVYPRACVPKDQYKGNRLAYETDCNQVGWALAELNPCLRGKRGLIQRAVDSWRNSNQDPRLRSRRVRRQAKLGSRAKAGTLTAQMSGSAGNGSAGHPGSGPGSVPSSRAPGKISTSSQAQPGHHGQHDVSPAGHDHSGGLHYSNTPHIHRPGSTPQHMTSPSDLRHAQTFPGYPAYPTAPTTLGPSMAPSIQGVMHGYGRPPGNTSMASTLAHENYSDHELYGNLPEAKRRKFIQIDDTQKGARVRVKVTLDQVDISEIPDSYRKQNSVYPQAYYPVQMQSTAQSTPPGRYAGESVEEVDDGPAVIGRTTVACRLSEGDGEVEVPQLSQTKRDRERKLNALGYRMAWAQSRVFANRPIFLGRALDVYRNKQRDLLLEEETPGSIPLHLETRPGKRRWLERTRMTSQGPSPAAPDRS